MNTFLRAQSQHLTSNSIRNTIQQGISMLCGLFIVVALMSPFKLSAAIGFANGPITPTLATPLTVCSGTSGIVSMTPTTCTIGGGPNWSATYIVDSSSDASTWYPAVFGTPTGTINAASGTLTYVTPVFTTTSSICPSIYYRIRLTGLIADCSGGTDFTSQIAQIKICPNAGTITGPSPAKVCVGKTITLADTTTGGTWSSSDITKATVGSTTGIVTGVNAGTARISYIMPGGCSATLLVTVNAAAASITGGPIVCVGATTTYNLLPPLTPGGGFTSGTPAVGTIVYGSGVFTGVSAGTTTLTYTQPNGCFSTFLVTVNDPPAPITCNTPICFGDTLCLCETVSGGAWSSSNLTVANVLPTGCVYGVGSGSGGTSTIVYGTAGIGCSVSTIITINPVPAALTGTQVICVGGTTTFASTTSGGTYSSSDITKATVIAGTGVITGVGAGTATISYVMPSGCFRTRTVTINTTPSPITGPTSVCELSTITLTSTPAGGTWTSSTPTTASIGSGTGIVSGVVAGTVTITYMIAAGCFVTAPLTVNTTPATLTGPQIVCEGSTTIFASTTSGGTWSSSDIAVGTVGSGTGIITGIVAGTATISYIMPVTGCFRIRALTVNPTPAAITGASSSVCVGGTITLSSATPGGAWSSGDVAIATVAPTTGVVTGAGAGVVNITYALPGGCLVFKTITVNALPAAITGSAAVCIGGTTTLINTTSGGTWSSSDVAVGTIGSASGILTGIAAGTTIISYITPAGCFATREATVNPLAAPISGPTNVCIDGTITLTTSSTGGAWSSSNTATATVVSGTGVVTGVAAGVVNISYTIGTGCFSFYTITVNPLPAVITGAASVCVGSSTTFFSTTSGVTWSSSDVAVATVGAGTGIINGVGVGTATITTATSFGCIATKVVTVNPIPSPIAGPSVVCSGSTITLSSTPAGGTWQTGNILIATIGSTTGILLGSAGAGGSVNVTYTLSAGCRAITNITVNPLPAAITGTATVCVGATTALSCATTGGTWSTTTPAIATVDFSTGVVTGVAPGTAVITYTLSTGCFRTTTVTVNTAPSSIIGPTTICVGSSVTFSSSTPGGTWLSSNIGVATAGVGSGVITGITVGTANITYTLAGGCLSITTITVSPVPAAISGTAVVCVGQSTTLSCPTPGGVWSGSNAAIATVDSFTGTITGVSPGSIIVLYTVSSGCSSSIVVTVNPLPAPITGPTSVCMGGTITLSSATPGVIWSSSIPPIADIGSSSGVVTPHLPGNTVITEVIPATGCSRNTVITVNPLPLPIDGTLTVCVGSITALSNPSPGFGTWSSSNSAVAPINTTTGILTGSSAGLSTITYTLSTGCFITAVATVQPLPAAITGFARTCIGFCTTLHDATSGGTWSSLDPTIATIGSSTGIMCGVTPGTVTISYTLPTGCATVVIATVDPIPAPPTGPLTLCLGSTATFTHTIPGGTWSSSDPSVASVFLGTGLVTALSAGTTNITYTLASGCTSFATLTVNPVPPANTGVQYMCVGATTTLSNLYPGGSWQSGNTSIATVGSATGVVTGVLAGTANISYILPTGCFATSTVTVYPLPAILGSVLVCPGIASTLTGSPAGGLWASSPTSIATIGSLSGVVNGIATGTAIITYTLSTSCSTTAIITVQPLPAATVGPNQVCEGSTITLVNLTAGGGTWSSSNPAIASIDTAGVVTGITSGTVLITFTSNATGCIITHSVTVNPLPGTINGPHEVCVGATIPLFTFSTGGSWSSAGVFTSVGSSSGIVTGVSAGVEDITYMLPTGCFTTYSVTVNPLPSVIAGSFTVCYGYTVLLSSAPSGGVWSITPPSVATIDTDGLVTAVSAGTATVTYTLGTGCFTTAEITVNPLPAPITGLLNICVNDTTTLYDTSSGGTWTSDNIYIAVIDPSTGLLASVSAGTVTITYTLPTGCFVTAVMTINPTPQPILGVLSACVGQTSTLSNITIGGSWSSSNTSIATIGSSTGLVTAIAPGTAIITYTLPSSCPRTAVFTVNPLPLPITGSLSICNGDTTYLSSPTPGGTWSSSNAAVAFIFLPTGQMIGMSPGSATITYMLPTGCFTAATVIVNPVPTASTITGNRVVCVGDTSTLSNPAFLGGSWTSLNPSIASIGLSSGILLGVSAGTTIITYTMPSGCDTTFTVTVNPLPAVITGVFAVCVGNTTTLSSATPGGTWSSSAPLVGSIDPTAGILTGISDGFTLVTYQLTTTGCRVTQLVTVNPLPGIIVGNSNICLGNSTILSSSSLGGGWSSSNTAIATVTATSAGFDSAIVNSISVGTVNITYTLPTGCFTVFVLNVRPLPTPISGPDTVCVGATITLTSAPLVPPAGAGTWTSSNIAKATIDPSTGVLTGIDTGVVTITYTISYGCYETYTVTIRPNPTAIYGPTSVCVGFTITAIDTSAGGTWSSSNVSIATIDPITGVITGVSAGSVTITYKFSVTQCYVTRVIDVHPIPNVTVSSAHPTVICKYASVVLNATGAGPGGTYSWTPPTGLSSVSLPTVTASPTITTTYTVTGTTVFGCPDTATVTVYIDSMLNDIKIIGKDSICKGDCTVLMASGREGTYFNWKPAIGLSCTICDTVTACPVQTVTYNALAIDSLGCRDSLFFKVTVMPLPVMRVTPNPAIVCNGSTTQLNVVDSFATASYVTKFAWFPNAFISCDVCPNPVLSNTFNLVYKVTGITPFGCMDSLKVPVTVLDSAFNKINRDTVICIGQSAQLNVSSFNPDGARSDFYWLNTDIPNPRITNPLVTPMVTTTYTVAVTPNVCWPDTLYTTVVVAPYPEITITPSSATVASGTQVPLTATVTNETLIKAYAWTPPQTLSCDVCYNTVATPTVSTTYTFTATSTYGCTSTRDVRITIGCDNEQVFIPNTFTPNGDGMNDRFYISGKGIEKITKFSIYNRWGELVYERYNIAVNDPSVGWDGQYKGIVLSPDVFYYYVEAICNLGDVFTYKGDVTLLR